MVLEPMANLSEMVAEAARKPENARFQTGGVTAGEWFARRIKNQRVKNRKVNPELSRVGFGTHSEEHLGTRDVEGKPGNGTQIVSQLRGGNGSDAWSILRPTQTDIILD